MTNLLEQAVEAARQKPADEQNDIAVAMLSMMQLGEPLDIEPEHRESVMTGMAQIERGEIAQGTASEIVARVFARARSRA